MYNEYTVSIFRFLNLFLHDFKCFSPAVYITALFLDLTAEKNVFFVYFKYY
jgi:hypothetical protein